jgi:hypothetical protein
MDALLKLTYGITIRVCRGQFGTYLAVYSIIHRLGKCSLYPLFVALS